MGGGETSRSLVLPPQWSRSRSSSSSSSAQTGGAWAILGTSARGRRREGIVQRASSIAGVATAHALLISGMPHAGPWGEGDILRVLASKIAAPLCLLRRRPGGVVLFASLRFLMAVNFLAACSGEGGRGCRRWVSIQWARSAAPCLRLPGPLPRSRGGAGRTELPTRSMARPGEEPASSSGCLVGMSPAADRNRITSVHSCIRSSSSDDMLPSSTVFMARLAMSRAAPGSKESLRSAWQEKMENERYCPPPQ